MPHPPLQPSHPSTWRRARDDYQHRLRSPKAREIGLALCDAMIAWDNARGPNPTLELLTAAIDSGATWVSQNAAHDLGLILPHHASRGDPFDLATDIWHQSRALGRSRMAWEAERICTPMSREQAVRFRTLGLHDRSKRVRGDAAYVAAKSELRELLPELLTMSRTDPDPRVRRHCEISYHLLDRGYMLEPLADDPTHDEITVLCPSRRAELGTLRTTMSVRRSVVESLGIDEVIDQLRRSEADLSPLSWED